MTPLTLQQASAAPSAASPRPEAPAGGPVIPLPARPPRGMALDARFPFTGPCGICGGPDSRHRLWDALDARGRSVDGPEGTAADYGIPASDVRLVMEAYADARRRHRPLPGRAA